MSRCITYTTPHTLRPLLVLIPSLLSQNYWILETLAYQAPLWCRVGRVGTLISQIVTVYYQELVPEIRLASFWGQRYMREVLCLHAARIFLHAYLSALEKLMGSPISR